MQLYIDTSDSDNIRVAIGSVAVAQRGHRGKAQILLSVVRQALREQGLSFKDIEKIKVNTGPGSFTGLRVGVSVANALGWALSVPVNGRQVKKDGPVKPNY